MKYYSFIFLILAIHFLSGCNQPDHTRNPPEIVSRDTDTVFNEVPGQQQLGQDAFEITAVDLLENVRKANKFIAAIDKYGLRNTLEEAGPFTVIALSDAAYGVNDTTNTGKKLPESEEFLKSLILRGNIDLDNLAGGPVTAENLNGGSVVMAIENGDLKINNTVYPAAERFTVSNGIVYELDEWKE